VPRFGWLHGDALSSLERGRDARTRARADGGVMPVAGDFRTPRLRADVVLGGVVAFAAAELDCRLFGPVLGMGTAGALPVWSLSS
jgi:hypothetical protein